MFTIQRRLFEMIALIAITNTSIYAVCTDVRGGYEAGKNYYEDNEKRNLMMVNLLFNKTYTSYDEKNPGHITGEFLQTDGYEKSDGTEYNHKGVDFRARSAMNVYSPIEGKVIATGGTYGKVVIYNKEHDVSFNFQHLSSIGVDTNEDNSIPTDIRIGDLIGQSGNKGTGAYHLHIGLRKGENTSLAPLDTNGCTSFDPRIVLDYISIIDGAGSIINPVKECWGCDRDEADMQVHTIPSTVVFQWNARSNSCPYLNIGLLDNNTFGIDPHESLDVVIHKKKWSLTSSSTYNVELPVTITPEDTWNTIAVTSQKPLKSVQKIVAFCSDYETYTPHKTVVDSSKVEFESKYVWAGNSSIIRRDNNDSTQADGIYKDVAIGLSDNKAITLFQWQPSDNCLNLELKAGFYDENFRATINSVDMKQWSDESWTTGKCNGVLPCTLHAPYGAQSYYIIKVKSNANAFVKDYIHAECK